ncbi:MULTISPECIES: glycosyltransferase [unclassified Xanthobacter]|uniref:glycosyltransferase n=1 Tax=unclassified Xanthobacter TaxID=2623496 RepID=UPI001EDCD5B6|nr:MULTISPECIES: glycosyltransferase [unclassified Xanthobacter]
MVMERGLGGKGDGAGAGHAAVHGVPPGAGASVVAGFPSDLPLDLPAELAPFRGHLAEDMLHWAESRARQIGMGGDEVLVAQGAVSRAEVARFTAAHLGLPLNDPLEPLPRWPVDPSALTRADLASAAARTATVVDLGGSAPVFIVAPQGRLVRRLARALRLAPELRHRLRLMAPDALRRQIVARDGAALATAAAFRLRDTEPARSAGTLHPLWSLTLLALLMGGLLLAIAAFEPALAVLVVQLLLSLVFLSWLALRLAGCCFDATEHERPLDLQDRDLPIYSILVPLYHEAASVPGLVAALARLNYPPEKLDIKLVVEADDVQTRAVIAALGLPSQMEEVAVPDIGPRTKPKALNTALALARGRYVAIFDAEDLPEPDQLRRALAAFRSGGPQVACVQARLTIDNGPVSWISGHFAAEYAAQFDVLLPVLSALELPILLGGTSNHFRRDVLERVGAWDPFNVTEDADLGIRLARAGWRTRVIGSSTFEEAPVSRKAWLGQRGRWLKGWAQTLLVHGRHPLELMRDLGWRQTLAVFVLTAGPYASALVHPFCLAILFWYLAQGLLGEPCRSGTEVLVCALTYTTFGVGYLGTALTMIIGAARRQQSLPLKLLATIPIYWLLLSWAAWRALLELVQRPHHWEKTQHAVSARGLRAGGAALKNTCEARRRPWPAVAWS